MVKTLCSTFKGAQVLSLVGELRTHEPCDKKKKERERGRGSKQTRDSRWFVQGQKEPLWCVDVCVLHVHTCVRPLAGPWQQVCLWACWCVWWCLCVCLGVSTWGRTFCPAFQRSRMKSSPSFAEGRGRERNGLAYFFPFFWSGKS